MPYTAQHLYNLDSSNLKVAKNNTELRKLISDSDVDAIREADVWLRSSRVLARCSGEKQPVAEVVLKDGQEVARISMDAI